MLAFILYGTDAHCLWLAFERESIVRSCCDGVAKERQVMRACTSYAMGSNARDLFYANKSV
jgi:hypothetical protein